MIGLPFGPVTNFLLAQNFFFGLAFGISGTGNPIDFKGQRSRSPGQNFTT
jgi:hypothetical protein